MIFLELLLFLILYASVNEASLFRGGTITAVPYSYRQTSVTMSITARLAYIFYLYYLFIKLYSKQ
jgi:hypothetical protein